MVYNVISESYTAHCCFKFSVIFQDEEGDDQVICECFDFESADKICSSLNKVLVLKAEREARQNLIK